MLFCLTRVIQYKFVRIFIMTKKYNQTSLFFICFLLLTTFAKMSSAETFVRFKLNCSAPVTAKANSYSDELWGIVTANGLSLFREFYSRSNKQPSYVSMTGKFKDGELSLIGKGYWVKKSGSYPFYFSAKAPSLKIALESELKGREGTNDWRRDCTLKKISDEFSVSDIAGSKRRIESLQSRLEVSLEKHASLSSLYEKQKNEFEGLKEIKNVELSDVKGLKSALSAKEKEFEEQQLAYSEETKALKNEISKLKKKKNSSNSTAELNEKLILLDSERNRLREALETVKSQLTEANSNLTQVEQLKLENKQLLSSLNESSQEIQILEKEFENAQSQALILSNKLSKSSQQSNSVNVDLEKIKNENISLKQQIVQLRSTKSSQLQSLTQQCSVKEKADSELINKLLIQNEEITQKCSADIISVSNQNEGSFIDSLINGVGNIIYSVQDAVVSTVSSAISGLVNIITRTIDIPLSLLR